jgi:thiosulfate/3-mercaptopyruvate sulfurtransferase
MSELSVSPEWLKQRLGLKDVKIVDASWYLPAQKRDPKAEFLDGHIPGAVFFDIDKIADRTTDLPHMLPDSAAFEAAAGALGLSENDTIIVYDGVGLFTAPRVWWTLKVFGAKDVRILEGGLPAWKRAGLPFEPGEARPEAARFHATFSADSVRSFESVRAHLATGDATIVDARAPARFSGEAPEPRPGLPSGHMPGARNLHYETLVGADGVLKPPGEIRKLFENAGVDLAAPVVTSCGSGVTAAVLLFALASLGKKDVGLYDGSWTEWASRPGAPIAKGPA